MGKVAEKVTVSEGNYACVEVHIPLYYKSAGLTHLLCRHSHFSADLGDGLGFVARPNGYCIQDSLTIFLH